MESDHEIVSNPQDSEVILVWTCGFRQDVIDNSIAELNRYRKEYPGEIIAIGCLPDIDRDILQDQFKGKIIPWKKEGKFFEEYFNADAGSFAASSPVFHENALCHDASEYRRLNPEKDAIFADQFFKLIISYGCPYECTYCTEKLAFPPYKSMSEDELVEACRIPVQQQGQHRIILIADCLGKYGSDTSSSLPQLIRRLHSEYPQTVYALQNFHPKNFLDFYEDMRQFLKDGWLAHINLPIQSASDKIISAMNRQYTRKDLDKVFGMLTNINFRTFDTHIIVGFPGETDRDFMETVNFLRKYKPAYALVSKYYDAPGAPASNMENKIDNDTMNRRLKIIEDEMKNTGIVYNIDGADFMQNRFSRINNTIEIAQSV
jgi:tRNA A37 methylthiotransferase MiaB